MGQGLRAREEISVTRKRMARSTKALAAKASLLALLAAPWLASHAAAQLYMPRTVKQAYANGTRSADGRPGSRYWQNRARYTMTITATPPDRTVRGTQEIVYVNSSPDSLANLVVKLFLNIHRPGAPRNGGASDDYLTSGMHIDRFAVNGAAAQWQSDPRFFTWQPVRLRRCTQPSDGSASQTEGANERASAPISLPRTWCGNVP
jgi:hypothetical protein